MNKPFCGCNNNKGETPSKVLIQVFALILFVVMVIFTIGKKTANKENNNIQKNQDKNLSSLRAAQNKNNIFPDEVPLNEKMNIYKSGKKTLNTGELIEELVVFNSKRTVSENQEFYEKWARANNWKVNNAISKEKDISSLSFVKDGKELQISLEQQKNNLAKITMIYTKL